MKGTVMKVRRRNLTLEEAGEEGDTEKTDTRKPGEGPPDRTGIPPPFARSARTAIFHDHLKRNGTVSRNEESIWYRLGWAIEEVMASLPPRSGGGRSPGEARTRKSKEDDPPTRSDTAMTGMILSAGSTLLTTVLAQWVGKRRFPLGILARGALAGAGAAGAVLALRILLRREEEGSKVETLEEVGDELLAGAGRGVLYATVLAPLLPGPPLLRGALAGSADFLASPAGGLFSSLQRFSPVRRLPILSALLETGDAEEDPYLTFLLHGTILGLLYGAPNRGG